MTHMRLASEPDAGMDEEERISVASYESSVGETVAPGDAAAASRQEARNALSVDALCVIKKYFEERMDTVGVGDTDGQLAALAQLLFTKHQVRVGTDELRDSQVATRIREARRAYADHHDMPMPMVT